MDERLGARPVRGNTGHTEKAEGETTGAIVAVEEIDVVANWIRGLSNS